METNKDRLNKLFTLYTEKQISDSEKDELMDYVNNPVFEQEIKNLISLDYERVHKESGLSEAQAATIIANAFETQQISTPKKISSWPRIAAAAAIIFVLGAGLLYFGKNDTLPITNQLAKNDIAPGSNKAFLTLTNGQRISLTDAANGNIASQSGVKIIKNADGSIEYKTQDNGDFSGGFNTTETPKGGQYIVNLADGSKVWLNAASSLKYPTTFANQKIRTVELTGEGYFEIAKDETHPFIVKTAKQDVEVLGTHFNINSYADEGATKTTLLEGSVRVSAKDTFKILKPDQQSKLASDQFIVSNVNAEDAIAWKNGLFVFDDETLAGIMRRIERWYDVEVIYQEGVNRNETYLGSVSRYDKVSKVLEGLELTKGIHFKIEGRRITVMK